MAIKTVSTEHFKIISMSENLIQCDWVQGGINIWNYNLYYANNAILASSSDILGKNLFDIVEGKIARNLSNLIIELQTLSLM